MLTLKDYILHGLISLIFLFGQFIFPLNLLLLFLSVGYTLYFVRKRSFLFLFPILSLSFYHGDASLSIYTLKIGGGSILYVILAMMFCFTILNYCKLKKITVYFFLVILVYVAYSIIVGSAFELNHFGKEVFFITVSLLFLIIVSKIDEIDYDFLFITLGTSYFTAKILVIITGVGLEVVPYSKGTFQSFALFDPIENFLLIYNVIAIFQCERKFLKRASFINFVLFIVASILLGYIHGGTIVMIFAVFLWVSIRHFKKILLPTAMLTALLASYSISFEVEKGSVNYYKIEKFIGLITFVIDRDFSIYDLPRSPQVRVIETANLLDQNLVYIIFGKGFGGAISETKYKYGTYLNADDYSEKEVKERKFFTLHTFNQLILKHGFITILTFCYFGFRARGRQNDTFIDTSLMFLILSYGYTIKPYLILALFLAEAFAKRNNKIHCKYRYIN